MRKWMILLFLTIAAFNLQAGESSLTIELVPGENWISTGNIGPIEITVEPSFAIWLEDKHGNYIETIYVTEKVAKSLWNGAVGRHDTLPVWGHSRGIKSDAGFYLPSKSDPMPDAVTSPTPLETFIWNWAIPEDLPEGDYIIKCEINLSFDFNETWTKGRTTKKRPYRNKVNGQPSLIYSADLSLGDVVTNGVFSLEGAGSATGKDGEIYPIEGIDSASELIKSLSIQ